MLEMLRKVYADETMSQPRVGTAQTVQTGTGSCLRRQENGKTAKTSATDEFVEKIR
jgi:hypothetical protein